LASWFETKQVLALCDETQAFKFENGIGLQKLCDCIGVESAFFLSVVLRMPLAITNRLMEARPSNIQVTSPRELEVDALSELIGHDAWPMAMAEIERLKDAGVATSDICILTASDAGAAFKSFVRGLGAQVESVARFRGLESPVVLVMDAGMMDAAQLFCAYSRATTACIAIYELSALNRSVENSFHAAILAVPENRLALDQAHHESLTSSILSSEFTAHKVPLETIDLAWSPRWRAWMVSLPEENYSAITWLDFLAETTKQPVFYWHAGSQGTISAFGLYDSDLQSAGSDGTFEVKHCKSCDGFTPHLLLSHVCTLCADPSRSLTPFRRNCSDLQQLDEVLLPAAVQDPRLKARVRALPIPLAAAAARRYAFATTKRVRVRTSEIPSGKRLYRAALAFVQARIALASAQSVMTIDAITDELRGRYDELAKLERSVWRGVIAQAFGTCYQKNLVVKVPGG
jgi:hypothetical protein